MGPNKDKVPVIPEEDRWKYFFFLIEPGSRLPAGAVNNDYVAVAMETGGAHLQSSDPARAMERHIGLRPGSIRAVDWDTYYGYACLLNAFISSESDPSS